MSEGQANAESWPDAPTEPDAFFQDLRAFYNDRGVTIDLHPRVNGKNIDLFELFKCVTGKGGYDKISAEKLAWRKIGVEFGLPQANQAAYAFGLKSVYLKNLAAYAIKRIHKQEPPPKEITEWKSAKGGSLLTRTWENYRDAHAPQEQANGNESETSDPENAKTPRGDIDTMGSGGRARSLRQAPPQRVLFQPDVSSSRQSRPASAVNASPQPTAAMTMPAVRTVIGPPVPPGVLSAEYEPTHRMALALRSLPTPANNPTSFFDRAKRAREAQMARLGKSPPGNFVMLPGTGFDGPNIYIRTLNALKCGISGEQDYALYHLVKISHERGDKFRFEAFSGLAEALIEKVLEVTDLFYEVQWEISYDERVPPTAINVLDGVRGTPDILHRLQRLKSRNVTTDLMTEEFANRILKCTEAGLVLRNMCMLEDNTRYMADLLPLRDLLSILLNLPSFPWLGELKHHALDIAEQVTKYWALGPQDPLYLSLLAQVGQGNDRGLVITSLHAICRISLNLAESNRIRNVPDSVIRKLMTWTMLDDDELISACLDFFYQFTVVPENVGRLLALTVFDAAFPLGRFLEHLTGLLSVNSVKSVWEQVLQQGSLPPAAVDIPELPVDLIESVMRMYEPMRSTQWLRCCFEEQAESEITQIALWQEYQRRFTPYNAQSPMLQAAEFIKNVSTTFPTANAQVVHDPAHAPRFIIKGIQPRRTPIGLNGRTYVPCLWTEPEGGRPCMSSHAGPKSLYKHVAEGHLGLESGESGQWQRKSGLGTDNEGEHKKDHKCYWFACQQADKPRRFESPEKLFYHVKVHIPKEKRWQTDSPLRRPTVATSANKTSVNGAAPKTPAEFWSGRGYAPETRMWVFRDSSTDERGHPVGIPYTAVLVLRNLARNVPKAGDDLTLTTDDDNEDVDGNGNNGHDEQRRRQKWRRRSDMPKDGSEWMQRLFMPLRTAIVHGMAQNRTLAAYTCDLMLAIEEELPGLEGDDRMELDEGNRD